MNEQDKWVDQANVLGGKGSTILADTSKHPHNGIGKIVCKFYNPEKKQYTQKLGTASIIGTNLILTVAHVLHDKQNNTIVDYVQFYPEQLIKNKQLIGQGIKVVKFHLNNNYFRNQIKQIPTLDFVFLELQKNDIIKQEQILKTNFKFIFQSQKQDTFNIPGYGSDRQGEQNCQFFQERKAQFCKDNMLYYKHTTYPGCSGGPILLKNNNHNYQIVGIHKGNSGNHNFGLLLNCLEDNAGVNQKHLFPNNISAQQLSRGWRQTYIPGFRGTDANFLQIFLQNQKLKKQIWQKSLQIDTLNLKIKLLLKYFCNKNSPQHKKAEEAEESVKNEMEEMMKQIQIQKINFQYQPSSLDIIKMVPQICEQVIQKVEKFKYNQSQSNQDQKKKINNINICQLQKYLNLKSIELRGNNIQDIPKLKNMKLQYMHVQNNMVKNLKLFQQGHYPRLKGLYLSRNVITQLPKFNTSNLQKLYVINNRINTIKQFSQKEYLKLKNLNLSKNQIKILPAFKTKSLQSLDVSFNKIQSIENFSKNKYPNLNQLRLDNNQIDKLPALNAIKLIQLSAKHNRLLSIQEFSKQQYENLTSINLSNNQIHKIPTLKASKLSELNIADNPIKDVKGLVESTVKSKLIIYLNNKKSLIKSYQDQLKNAPFKPNVQVI